MQKYKKRLYFLIKFKIALTLNYLNLYDNEKGFLNFKLQQKQILQVISYRKFTDKN